ncbi:hypothetical protein BGZ65_012197 [Modicella reniformis]|uniref:Uncharacterized protein n=1 Tax=Modicella reniformis TaxID=1440133 RepID=A0A9P6JFU1_9FUNG|nr:hypothetical protein BGZ65_012197 [Modicella reniformis]
MLQRRKEITAEYHQPSEMSLKLTDTPSVGKRPADQTVEAPSAQKVKVIHVDGNDQQLVSDGDGPVTSDSDIDSADDRYVSLQTRLMVRLFEDRPAKHEARAAQYIANMWQSPSPTPTVEGYLNFISETYPSAPQSGVARSWNKLKEYFSGGENTDLSGSCLRSRTSDPGDACNQHQHATALSCECTRGDFVATATTHDVDPIKRKQNQQQPQQQRLQQQQYQQQQYKQQQ